MDKHKICSLCLENKVTDEFYKNKSWKDGFYPYCKICTKDVRRKFYKRHKDKIKARCKEWYSKNSKKVKDQHFEYKYGINSGWYEQTLNKQNQCCAICGGLASEKRMVVDHCHNKNKVRGLLCANCNVLLGMAGDNIELLKSAIKYLRRFKL